MKTVPDYSALSGVAPREGMDVLVLSTRFIYRYRVGCWLFLGREPASLFDVPGQAGLCGS